MPAAANVAPTTKPEGEVGHLRHRGGAGMAGIA